LSFDFNDFLDDIAIQEEVDLDSMIPSPFTSLPSFFGKSSKRKQTASDEPERVVASRIKISANGLFTYEGGKYNMKNPNDYRTLEQIINDLMQKDAQQQNEINTLNHKIKNLTDRMMILYKEFKKFGHSIELFD